MQLHNKNLRVSFADSFPILTKYEFLLLNQSYFAQDESFSLIVNNIPEPWDRFEIITKKETNSVTYTCINKKQSYCFIIDFQLKSSELHFRLSVDDPQSIVNHISFTNYPLFLTSNPNAKLTRQFWLRKPFWSKYGRWMFKYATFNTKLWWTTPDLRHPRFMVHGCITIPNQVCCAVYSNFRVKPIFIRVKRRGLRKFAEIGAYQYSPVIRGMNQPPLEIKIAFLRDFNEDGKIDESDYYFWLNKQLSRNFRNLHKERIWYKIFCASPEVGISTSFDQAHEIIKSIFNVTDGFPQTVYLVGWQMNPKNNKIGHDTNYPTLNHLNLKLGTKEDFWIFFEDMKKYNTIMSCHINIDDAYKSSTDWDESIMCTEKDGSPFRWEKYNNEQSYHISHTKDVESGKIFQRLDEFFQSLPIEKMIHIDAMRNSNLNWQEGDFITAIDELYAGLIPIFRYFKQKGIEVSMEGLDFHPTEYAGIVSGIWHKKKDRNQVYFGNLVGGGFDKLSDYTTGFAWSIYQDIYWERFQDWDQILDEILTGSLLSRFLLQYEMKSLQLLPLKRGYDIYFSEDMHAKYKAKQLEISKEDYYIVKNGVYMIPFPEKIYLYSKEYQNLEILLPKEWRTESIQVFQLSKQGKKQISDYSYEMGVLSINLQSRSPLLIKRSKE